MVFEKLFLPRTVQQGSMLSQFYIKPCSHVMIFAIFIKLLWTWKSDSNWFGENYWHANGIGQLQKFFVIAVFLWKDVEGLVLEASEFAFSSKFMKIMVWYERHKAQFMRIRRFSSPISTPELHYMISCYEDSHLNFKQTRSKSSMLELEVLIYSSPGTSHVIYCTLASLTSIFSLSCDSP